MAGQDFQQWHVSEPYLETHCSLGEGPFYEPATNTLRFVDIIKQQLHTVSLTEGPSSLKTFQFDEAVTVTADIEGRDPQDALLIGAKQGLAVLDRKTGKYEYVTKFDQDGVDRIRSNDGAVDPNGRFWLGTMTDFGKGDFRPEGELSVFVIPSIESRGERDESPLYPFHVASCHASKQKDAQHTHISISPATSCRCPSTHRHLNHATRSDVPPTHHPKTTRHVSPLTNPPPP
jgi:hypothetical protein